MTPTTPSAPGDDARAQRFLRACRREATDVTPIWMMRQAGRSLPSYRAMRERYGFLEIIRDPELMADVTLLPLEELEVDAAIVFADIMLPLACLDVGFDIVENVGPVIHEPIRSAERVRRLGTRPVAEGVPTLPAALTIVRERLAGRVPVIGFSGAPFTLASYMIEGKASRDFAHTKAFMYGQPLAWDTLMTRLADLVVEYLGAQVAAGAQAVQVFDSWIGALAPQDVERYVLPYSQKIFAGIASLGVPRIHFGTGTAGFLELMSEVDCEVVGADWRVPLDVAWDRIGGHRAVQGNLDPAVLLGPPALVVERAKDVLRRAAGRPGHIFNLGHGVLPATPVENLRSLVETVHAYDHAKEAM